jgi:hypothetical protein
MDAYELADRLDLEPYGIYGEQAANILRQQADRIAELSKNVDELEEELLKTPQIKELSDEEIEDLIDNWDFGLDISPKHHMFLLCKTILKKASEK